MVEIKKAEKVFERQEVIITPSVEFRVLLDRIAKALEEMNRGVKGV